MQQNSIGISEVANTQDKPGISTRSKGITKISKGKDDGGAGQTFNDNGSDDVSLA